MWDPEKGGPGPDVLDAFHPGQREGFGPLPELESDQQGLADFGNPGLVVEKAVGEMGV